MDTKAVSQSVDGATKAIKSSFTEGSSKLFGSVMDAKRGLFGGITSTFDHVVNIVGGPDDGSKATAATSASGGEAQATGRPPLDSKPPFKRRNTNPFMEGYDPNVVENEIPPPTVSATGAIDGATVVPAYQSAEPSRAWDNMGGTPGVPSHGGPRIPSGEPSAFLAPGHRDGKPVRNRGGDESDADSDATEGCDDDDAAEAAEAVSEAVSGNVDQSWNIDVDDLSQLDGPTKECIEFMKYFVNKIIDPAGQVTSSDKAKFGELCQQGNGRLWFAKFVNAQKATSKALPEPVILTLVQFIATVLFECNEAEDYGPARTLMDIAFTFYHELQDAKTGPELTSIFNKLKSLVVSKQRTYLYSYLKDQAIWQSPRFWNAAFFYAVQQNRATKPTTATNILNHIQQTDDVKQQENLVFGQLRTFTSNMRTLGVPKDHCLEFIRRQASLANLPKDQVNVLRESMEQWTEEAANK